LLQIPFTPNSRSELASLLARIKRPDDTTCRTRSGCATFHNARDVSKCNDAPGVHNQRVWVDLFQTAVCLSNQRP
jgi:hypothetical protein